MRSIRSNPPTSWPVKRRQFFQGLTGSALLLSRSARASWGALNLVPQVLSGTDFDLSIGEAAFNFTGQDRNATLVNGTLPAPILK